MKKTIYPDAILNFGKHKGKPVADVLTEDTGYFLWLSESDYCNLDDDIAEVVDAWAIANKKEADKVRWSARKVKDDRAKEKGVKATVGVAVAHSVTTEVHYASTPPTQQEAWGTW